MQAERLFKIVYYLLYQESASAQKIADYLGVSKRTVFRDIDTLSLSGIPIYAERGSKGGFKLMDNFVLNKSIISEQEQNEILSALQNLSAVKTDETSQTLAKLKLFFKKEPADWFSIDITGWGDAAGIQHFSGIKAAIIEKRIIEFVYFNMNCEKSQRRVEPIKLWFKAGSWYLSAFCLDKQGIRLFKLARTRDLAITDEIFAERKLPAFDPDNESAENLPGQVKLVMKIAPEMTYRVYDYCEEKDIAQNDDGSMTITQWWDFENNAMYGFILSFGEYAEVLAPGHLREIIREKGLAIAEKNILQ